MNLTPKGRILQLIDYQKVSIRIFCKKILVSSSYFAKNSAMGSDIIEKIAELYPNLNIDWVITGRGEMFLKNDNNSLQVVNSNEQLEIAKKQCEQEKKTLQYIIDLQAQLLENHKKISQPEPAKN